MTYKTIFTMCNFIEAVEITAILSGPSLIQGRQEMMISIFHDQKSVPLRLVKSEQAVTAHYGNDGLCEVLGNPDLATLKVGDTIELGPGASAND